MKVAIYNCLCTKCKHKFQTPMLSDFTYGEFILRTKNNEVIYLNSFDSVEFEEILGLFNGIVKNDKRTNEINEAAIFQYSLGVCCDLSETDQTYKIKEGPICPKCAEFEAIKCSLSDPVLYLDLPGASFKRWNALSKNEKELLLSRQIESYFNR